MSTLRLRIIAESITWTGTPYHPLASLKGIGTDCIGYIIGIAKAVGVLDQAYAPPTYSPQWHLHNTRELLREGIEDCGGRVTAHPEPADILLFHFALTASHAAILLPENFLIHAVLNKRVLRQRYTSAWRMHYAGAYTFPGVC